MDTTYTLDGLDYRIRFIHDLNKRAFSLDVQERQQSDAGVLYWETLTHEHPETKRLLKEAAVRMAQASAMLTQVAFEANSQC